MFNFIKKQFIDVIQWPNPDDSLLMWRFPIADEEIQNGASLTVREAQMAMFVDEGVTADVFGPGRYTLNTQTLPVLTNLKNWDKLLNPLLNRMFTFSIPNNSSHENGVRPNLLLCAMPSLARCNCVRSVCILTVSAIRQNSSKKSAVWRRNTAV